MRRRRPRERPPSLALSFVDTISGGFGAAFFLFLIFASLPIDEEANRTGGGSRFIEIWLKWPDAPPIAELYLRHDQRPWLRFTSSRMHEDSQTGRLTVDEPLRFWRQAFASGFSWFGDAYMTKGQSDAGTNMRAVRFRLADHCAGTLEVSAAVYGRRTASDWLNREATTGMTAELEVIISSGRGSKTEFTAKDIPVGPADGQPEPIEVISAEANAQPIKALTLEPPTTDFPWCQPR